MSDVYEFDTDGEGCPQCQAMEGCYEYEPDRPHDYCLCTIRNQRDDYSYDYKIIEWYWATGTNGEDYISGVDYEVKISSCGPCMTGDGDTVEEEFHMDQTQEESDDGTSELHNLADENAEFLYQNWCVGFV